MDGGSDVGGRVLHGGRLLWRWGDETHEGRLGAESHPLERVVGVLGLGCLRGIWLACGGQLGTGARCTDIRRRGVVVGFYALWRTGKPVRLLPGLVEKLGLSSAEAVAEPALGGVVEDGKPMEERDAVFGERVRVLGDAGVVDAGGDEGEDEGEGDEGSREGSHGAARRTYGTSWGWRGVYSSDLSHSVGSLARVYWARPDRAEHVAVIE